MSKRKFDETNKTTKSNQGTKKLKTNSTQSSGFFSLYSTLNDATKQVYKDEKCVCIYDKYPKAKYHFLLVPTLKPDLKQLNELNSNTHLDLLKYLNEIARNKIIIDRKLNRIEFKIGFHAIQSMFPLHIHIISDDFNSESLKTKKHWNSFNSGYFLTLDNVIQHLETNENLNNLLESKAKLDDYLKEDLKCNKCNEKPKNMPKLKEHLMRKH
jgi:aprataxin